MKTHKAPIHQKKKVTDINKLANRGRHLSQRHTWVSETTPSVDRVISVIGTWRISYSHQHHDKDQRSSHETSRHFLQVALQVQPRTKAKWHSLWRKSAFYFGACSDTLDQRHHNANIIFKLSIMPKSKNKSTTYLCETLTIRKEDVGGFIRQGPTHGH